MNMNSIDLLEKLNLPNRIGLEGDDALFNKQVIMDAYLSAASLQFNRQLFGMDNTKNMLDGKSQDTMFTLNSLSAELPRISANIDLFRAYPQETSELNEDFESNDTKIILD